PHRRGYLAARIGPQRRVPRERGARCDGTAVRRRAHAARERAQPRARARRRHRDRTRDVRRGERRRAGTAGQCALRQGRVRAPGLRRDQRHRLLGVPRRRRGGLGVRVRPARPGGAGRCGAGDSWRVRCGPGAVRAVRAVRATQRVRVSTAHGPRPTALTARIPTTDAASKTDLLRFSKGEGLGNDYIVVDAAELPVELTTERIRRICDRHRGVGSDGILVADLSDGIALRIWNPDGTEAEKSGNGLRIFGAWLFGRGVVQLGEWFPVRLIRDTVRMRVEERLDRGQLMIRVEMGRATFNGRDVDFTPNPGETLDYTLDLGDGLSARINTVSLSNRHCVVFVDELTRDDFEKRAPRLCTHPSFAEGTNVQLARVAGP